MASTRLSLAEAFGSPARVDVWNPGLDVEYVALGHIQATEFDRRLAAWNGLAIDPGTVRHTWVLLDRHEQGCDAPPPSEDDDWAHDCCDPFGLHPVVDVRHRLPVHFHAVDSPGPGAVAVTYARLGSETAARPA